MDQPKCSQEHEKPSKDGDRSLAASENAGAGMYSYSFSGKGTVGLFKRTDGSPWKQKPSATDCDTHCGGDDEKSRWEPISESHSAVTDEGCIALMKARQGESRIQSDLLESKNTWVEVSTTNKSCVGSRLLSDKDLPLDLAVAASTKFNVVPSDAPKMKSEEAETKSQPLSLLGINAPITPAAIPSDSDHNAGNDISSVSISDPKDDDNCQDLMKGSEDMEIIEDEEDEDDDEGGELQAHKPKHAITGRGVTLSMLMADGTIKPGEKTMSIEYLGQKFDADLLPGGKIRWTEQKKIFGSPSAWAIHCKKIVNPGKKSGCGWASVKYKGKKLDAWKSSWLRKKRPLALAAMGGTEAEDDVSEDAEVDETDEKESPKEVKPDTNIQENKDPPKIEAPPVSVVDAVTIQKSLPRRPSVRHSTLGRKSAHHDASLLVDTIPFSMIAKLQPFHMSISSNALLAMDFHSHMTKGEVIGYLGGKWDSNNQLLTITHAFPCLCQPNDGQKAGKVEEEIRQSMGRLGVTIAGWYHSHPTYQSDPSLRDIELQMEYQYQLKGANNSYQPCIGLIISPYDAHSGKLDSTIQPYWIMPPPEHRPLDYGMPMLLEYSVSQDSIPTKELLAQLREIRNYHRSDTSAVKFSDLWYLSDTYLDKLKTSLSKRFQGSSSNAVLLQQVQEILVS